MNAGETSAQNYFHRHINYAISILEKYDGREPFHLYLKKYFSQNKKHGSKDRKQITALCYNYFRLGMSVNPLIPVNEKLLLATFLTERKPSSLLEKLKPERNQKITLDLQQKIQMVKEFFSLENLFPFKHELSDEIDSHAFSLSFLIQPKLFIRIRPRKKDSVFEKLKTANIQFEIINENCLAFSNAEKISDALNIDKEAVIQDFNSQQTLNLLTSHIKHQKSDILVWDCCAASGGKSILAFDLLQNVQLTVTDTRKSILENLRRRFAKAGIKKYDSFIADLSISPPLEGIKGRLDLIIADVPCSGSGTWARTPEQLIFFNEKKIQEYSTLQKNIVSNVVKNLNNKAYLLYITCSVLEKENEQNIRFFEQKLDLELIESNYFKGYEIQADTLFAALLRKKI